MRFVGYVTRGCYVVIVVVLVVVIVDCGNVSVVRCVVLCNDEHCRVVL